MIGNQSTSLRQQRKGGAVRTVIGVDAGGTSTKALLVDHEGRGVGGARTGPGNVTSAGFELAAANLAQACLGAWRSREDDRLQGPGRVVITAAGNAPDHLPAELEGRLAAAGLACRVEVVGDLLGAWFSAATESDGAVVIAGTGMNAGGIVDGELVRTADGLGWLLGDVGSGFWIGHAVARAVAADLDGYGEPTAMTRPVVALVGERTTRYAPWRDQRLEALMDWAYGRRPVELSELAPLVLAHRGDAVAERILAEASVGVVRRVEQVRDEGTPLVLTGGLLGDESPIAQALRVRWPGWCRRAADGRAGAAMLALRRDGVPAEPGLLARVQRAAA